MKIKTVAWIVCGILVGSLALVGLVKLTNNDAKVDDEPQYTQKNDGVIEGIGDYIENDGFKSELEIVPLTD